MLTLANVCIMYFGHSSFTSFSPPAGPSQFPKTYASALMAYRFWTPHMKQATGFSFVFLNAVLSRSPQFPANVKISPFFLAV